MRFLTGLITGAAIILTAWLRDAKILGYILRVPDDVDGRSQ